MRGRFVVVPVKVFRLFSLSNGVTLKHPELG